MIRENESANSYYNQITVWIDWRWSDGALMCLIELLLLLTILSSICLTFVVQWEYNNNDDDRAFVK